MLDNSADRGHIEVEIDRGIHDFVEHHVMEITFGVPKETLVYLFCYCFEN
jgi:hypothetical protein